MDGLLIIALVALVGAGAALAIWHAERQVRRAERLANMGWRCIGINFFTGPIMIPPVDAAALAEQRTGGRE